jgi:hypothetical protein
MGRTQAEMRYILETVLDHLPIVSGSERDMNVYIIQKNGHSSSSSCDEFGMDTNNLIDRYGNHNRLRGWLRTQDEYILVVDGALRDREFDRTFREFQKWLCRLAKRIDVENVMVEIKGYGKSTVIRNYEIDPDNNWTRVYSQMFEEPTWMRKYKKNGISEPNWCEYLMWDRAKDSDYPMMLGYKYFDDPENDAEVERRLGYLRGEQI